MERLNQDEIAHNLDQLGGWKLEQETIRKTYRLPDFVAAITFVTQVAFRAEAAGHHPDIDIRYNQVHLSLTTHDAGGLTAKDFALAAQADEIMG